MTKSFRNIVILGILTIGVGCFSYYLFILFEYKKELNQSNKERYHNEYIPLEFNGRIIEFSSDPAEEERFYTIRIRTDTEKLTYGLWVIKGSDFSQFVERGDSVIKYKGDSKVKFIKLDGRQKSFELPFK